MCRWATLDSVVAAGGRAGGPKNSVGTGRSDTGIQKRKRPAVAGPCRLTRSSYAVTPEAVSTYSSIWSKFRYL